MPGRAIATAGDGRGHPPPGAPDEDEHDQRQRVPRQRLELVGEAVQRPVDEVADRREEVLEQPVGRLVVADPLVESVDRIGEVDVPVRREAADARAARSPMTSSAPTTATGLRRASSRRRPTDGVIAVVVTIDPSQSRTLASSAATSRGADAADRRRRRRRGSRSATGPRGASGSDRRSSPRRRAWRLHSRTEPITRRAVSTSACGTWVVNSRT